MHLFNDMTTFVPTRLAEREKFMDVLRGLAILGIFIANLNFLSLYRPNISLAGYHYSYDNSVRFLHAMFIEGKFYSIFSLLFGWGMAIQIQKLQQRNPVSLAPMKRRLWGMLLLGLCHIILLWNGDIVAFYAMLGFILLLFRNASDKKLLVWAGCLILSPILLYFLKMNVLWVNAPAGILREFSNYLDHHINHLDKGPRLTVSSTSSWAAIWKLNIAGSFFRFAYLFFVSRIPKVLGVFLIGYWLGKDGRYKKILNNGPLLRRIAIIGFVIGLPCNYMLARFMENGGDYFNLTLNGWYQTVVYTFGVVPLAMAYAACIALLYRSTAGNRLLSLLQPVGKMAFSNYILHSLIGVISFYGVGFGWGGRFGPTAWTIFALAVFLFQIVFSYTWLRAFNFGPVEWLWRSMTYKKWQPMRKVKHLTT